MRKLHLIKPWRLRAVRQKLNDGRNYQPDYISYIPANCPTSGEGNEIPARGAIDGRSEHRKKAPVSDVIFAAGTIRNIR